MAIGIHAGYTNGVKLTEPKPKDVLEYEKILKFRKEFHTTPSHHVNVPIKPLNQGMGQANGLTTSVPSSHLQHDAPILSSPPVQKGVQNGVHKLPKASHTIIAESKVPVTPASHLTAPAHKSSNTQRVSTPASSSSGLDPIFLTKSEVLLKAELQQKRQRLERTVEEQCDQSRVIWRHNQFDQEALPNFNVSQVLKEAQQIVKPINLIENNGTNRTASSSDSFDDNTFYSSQMNDSTTTEEADELGKMRSDKASKYSLDGRGPEGDTPVSTHEVAPKRRIETNGAVAMDINSVDADQQAHSQPSNTVPAAPTNHDSHSAPASELDRISTLNHIEQLEAQLATLKAQQARRLPNVGKNHPGDAPSAHDEPAYSPPDAGDVVTVRQSGRDEIREPGKGKVQKLGEGRAPVTVESQSREYIRRDPIPQSPLPSEVRVIRNHITSPAAPQPARVSPLAVARVPQLHQGPVHQGQRVFSDSNHPFQGSGLEASSGRQSPRNPLQPLNTRKRRRDIEIHERVRNVAARLSSPEIQIKREPLSPPPHAEPSETWQPRRRQDATRPIYIEMDSPRYQVQEPIIYQPRSAAQAPQRYLAADERQPLTPIGHRVVSRNGQIGAHEEQDLRRVVSARQLRIPRSPIEQYAPSQSTSARAASQTYLPQSDNATSLQPRASVQPLPSSRADRNQSLSPLPRFSSPMLKPMAMLPPARRIVVDQYGQRYEDQIHSDRQGSSIPLGRPSEYVPRYEQLVPRSPTVREPQVVNVYDERRYVRRAPSPHSSHYVEYHPRRVFDRESDHVYSEEVYLPRNDVVRAVEYSEPRSAGRYEEIIRPRVGELRTQSVRPAGVALYEEPREPIVRIQSVRPDDDGIVNLENRREIPSQASRQVSVRAPDTFSRPVTYTGGELPKYRYMTDGQERRYVDEVADEVVYDGTRSSGIRPLQRL